MSNFTDFFPAAGGGGGGGTPKFQEFISSGTFTPTQALIDAGGYIDIFIVGGGARKNTDPYGCGGETILQRMYLTSTSAVTVTIGAGGVNNGNSGGASQFLGSTAGGSDLTAGGGAGNGNQNNRLGAGFGAGTYGGAGSGVFGYGAGASIGSGGVYAPKANSGQGGGYFTGGSGYCLIKWQE